MKELEWDEVKNQRNIRIRHLSFQTVSYVFQDINRLEFPDSYPDEERFKTIGLINDHLVVVIYTMRGTSIRIISARPATKKETEQYFKRKQ